MIQSTLLRAADYPRMPWKNGGGSTEEITRDSGTGLEGFGWRLSIADIGESGGFSSFAGYQRIITVLQGAGMQLSVDGQEGRPLLPFDPFAFSGASQVSCNLLGGAIRDFNLIYSPERYLARLQWFDGQQRFFTQAHTVLVFSAAEQAWVDVTGATVQALGRFDCLRLDGNAGLLEMALDGHCCVIELTAL
ncbi:MULTISPECIES: HutD family protein [Pseudomonas]|uniref:HutD family protein n=1 Tax=Pseudomonas sessilinigenes TaxID=658629 RepID=A0ABX8MPH9_9PSED|nr:MULTISPECIES: HutD family protein [Pseudomonas]AZC22111.1 Stresses-induced protein Ves (HutD) [Pseudomonas sessilinigenes]QIH05734.1 HutD family protein [Pseudomonas sp. BIOMIG1BAC]QXH41204.1 HutD family protein [Pseudomonas sessilinigenes]